MTPDGELLRRYAQTGSEEAFAELVSRYLDLVYSAALRQVNGDRHLAQDVSQIVFTDLARKAARLSNRAGLAGWLYTAAHHAAAKVVRTDTRRRAREQEGLAMPQTPSEPVPNPDWEKLRRVLDEAMHELREDDREAILLRFFENRPYADVGGKLGLTENAARMRVERALEKLRASLAVRGLATAAAISDILLAHATESAPAGLAASIAAASVSGAAGAASPFILIKALTMTSLKLGIISGIAVAGLATVVVIQHKSETALREQNGTLQQQADQLAQLQADNEQLSNRLASATVPGLNEGELLRLRGEVSLLRRQTNELGRLRDENNRLRGQLRQPPAQTSADSDSEADPARQAMMSKLVDAKMLGLAAIQFAMDHGKTYPTGPEGILPYMQTNKDKGYAISGTNDFDLVFQGSLDSVTNPGAVGTTIVFREHQPWQQPDGRWARAYGFLDGHAEVHSEPDVNALNGWEQARIFTPSSQ